MKRMLIFFAGLLLMGAGFGCDNSSNAADARLVSGLKTGVVTQLREKNSVDRDVMRGFEIELTLQGQDDGSFASENVDIEIEIQNRFDPTTACIGHPYGGEASGGSYTVNDATTPCYDVWFHNHKGNTGPGEGWINGKQLAPGESLYLQTNKNGTIKFPLIWKLNGDGFVDYHSAAKIQILARAVRKSHPAPDLVINFDLDFAYNGTRSLIEIKPAPLPWPAFQPDPEPQRLSVADCPVILSTVDTDGDGFPDDVDECPGSSQGKAGPCGCGGSVQDLDDDWVMNCPSISPQPAGTDRWPSSRHCGLEDHCGQSPDLDHDGDADMDDFGIFQRCFGHVTVSQPNPCDLADTNWDDIVDGNDAAVMRPCQSGVGVPVNVPACLPTAP